MNVRCDTGALYGQSVPRLAIQDDGMHDVLTTPAFHELHSTGFIRTGISLPPELTAAISQWYNSLPDEQKGNLATERNRGFLRARARRGDLRSRTVYDGSVFADNRHMAPVMAHLLKHNISALFRTRYMIASHDILLSLKEGQMGFGIHFDEVFPSQLFSGPHDLSIYIPLVQVDGENGGRLRVLPTRTVHPHSWSSVHLRALRQLVKEGLKKNNKGLHGFELEEAMRTTSFQSKLQKKMKSLNGPWNSDHKYRVDNVSAMAKNCWRFMDAAPGEGMPIWGSNPD